MQINFNSQQNFTSINNPIKPFVVNTSKGRLYVRELSADEIRKKGFIERLTKLFVKNFASLTNDPAWLMYNDPSKKCICDRMFADFVRCMKERLLNPNGNLTMLAAFDRNNRLQGACMSFGFDEAPACQKSVCYIENLAVNKRYRGEGLGKIFVNKTLEAVQRTFTDVFLIGELLAEGFYKKLGFVRLDANDKAQKTVIDFIAQDRYDYPKYVSFLTKPLQENKPRWYINTAKEIENLS